jgi:hypothetical protein
MKYLLLFLTLAASALPQPKHAGVIFVTPSEKTLKVAILDSGFDMSAADSSHRIKLCNTGHYDFNKNMAGISSSSPHGTFVASALSEGIEDVDYCILVFNVLQHDLNKETGMTILNKFTSAIDLALTERVVAINISVYGSGHRYTERAALQRLSRHGIHIFVAAGNSHMDLNKACLIYPACYRGIPTLSVVGSTGDNFGEPAEYSSYGERVTEWYYGDVIVGGRIYEGTSFASPRAMSDYVRTLELLQKSPKKKK